MGRLPSSHSRVQRERKQRMHSKRSRDWQLKAADRLSRPKEYRKKKGFCIIRRRRRCYYGKLGRGSFRQTDNH